MSDSKNSKTETDDAQFPDIEQPLQIEQPKPPRKALWLALLATTLAIVALLGLAYVVTFDEPVVVPVDNQPAIDALNRALDSTNTELRDVQSKLQRLEGRGSSDGDALRRYQEQLESQLSQQLDAQLQVFESLPPRMNNLENTMSSIQGIAAGVKDHWLLAEAEYYMQIANAQLQLAGNPNLARLALLQADERVAQLADPALVNVRRTLVGELRTLQSMELADIEGIALALDGLSDEIANLPLRKQISAEESADSQSDEELSGMARAMASLKSTVSSAVSIRRVDESVRPLISPEAEYFLRANISLQLEAARLALLRGEQAMYRRSLADASSWLDEYFDSESVDVQAALITLEELDGAAFRGETPDISRSLRLLRQYNALTASPDLDNGATIELGEAVEAEETEALEEPQSL
jgi:uroporphyrin-3 C-methyltransferase